MHIVPDNERAVIIANMRAVADFLEANPTIPINEPMFSNSLPLATDAEAAAYLPTLPGGERFTDKTHVGVRWSVGTTTYTVYHCHEQVMRDYYRQQAIARELVAQEQAEVSA